MKLTEKERDIILAALRFWQDERRWFTPDNEQSYLDIATNGDEHEELSHGGIDKLAEKLNRGK